MFPSTAIGIYGVSGSGKSRALSRLQEKHPEWRCLEGSCVIEDVLKEKGKGFGDFVAMDDVAKTEIRNAAIKIIGSHAGLTIVAGHASFLETAQDLPDAFNDVFTEGDAKTYKAILYLDISPEQIFQQRESDNETQTRHRSSLSVESIDNWIQHEKELLRRICNEHGIYFALVHDENNILTQTVETILPPLVIEAEKNSHYALKSAVSSIPSADVYLLIDGDRTLSPEDTGNMFFDAVADGANDNGTLKKIFQRYPTYTFQAFLEVSMLYERLMSQAEYETLSEKLGAHDVTVHQAWVEFLSNLPLSVHPVLVSSGNREIWSAVLESQLSTNVAPRMSIIAGNHIGLHPYIVDGDAKAMVVEELRQQQRGCKIISFGDSAIDIPMLERSDRGYIIIDDRFNRSMNGFIHNIAAISRHFQQLYLYEDASSFTKWHPGIPVGSLESLLQELSNGDIHSVFDCCKVSAAASVLATQTRRADLSGPDLQDCHSRVGMFLADKLMDMYPDFFVKTKNFPHVQGASYEGTVPSANLLIIPLMRGGEPMSRGVYDRFPYAQLVHYHNEEESTRRLSTVLLSNSSSLKVAVNNVIIVDSVVNEGKSVRNMIGHIEKLVASDNATRPPRVYVLTAVMQKEASLCLPKEYPRVRFLALRISENKYKGRGGTDTGNRLFGTC